MIMSQSTNELVGKLKRSIVPASIATTAALGAVLVFNYTGVHASSIAAGPLDDSSVSALTSLDSAMEAVTTRVAPAVVNIAVTSKVSPDQQQTQGGGDGDGDGGNSGGGMQGLPPGFAQFFGQGGGGMQMQRPQQPQLEHGIGSGVILSPDGYIVTNDHVVDGATQIRVTLHDRRVYTGKVVGVDKLTDLAVVKITGHDLPSIPWGNSDMLIPGQTVLAFGSPFGYFQDSVTRGIVSAVNRANPYSTDARKPGGYIQTDAAINPGNSGGALVNAHGELVGINTFIISETGSFAGAGFAIPSDIAKNTVQQLIAHGKVDHGYLGITLNDVTPDNAKFFKLQDASGTIVAQVTPDSPAGRAGLKQGDVIVGLNGHHIIDSSALQVQVSEIQPGTHIQVGIMRNGQPSTVDVTVGTFGGNSQVAANGDGQGGANNGKLGLAVADLNDQTRQQIQAPGNLQGAVVQQVRPGSPAEDAGLQPGDVILEVNRQPATNANQFVSEVHGAPSGQDVLLLVWSKGNASYRTLHPDNGSQGGE
jgi:serine protease Do